MVKKPVRGDDGKYLINGVKFNQLFGSRIQVWNGTAYKTKGELTKDKLIKNKWDRIVSKNKHTESKKHNRLLEHGYTAKKGKFGFVRVKPRATMKRRGTNKKSGLKGGNNNIPLTPAAYSQAVAPATPSTTTTI